MLVLDPTAGQLAHASVADLPRYLRPDDLLVLNDAATVPASLRGTTSLGEPLEVRLAGRRADGGWTAVLLGAGDWRTPTERRPPPPVLCVGARLRVAGLDADVVAVAEVSPRLVGLAFSASDEDVWRAIYAAGSPVQYAYVQRTLHLWDVQTAYASAPVALEMPSAGRPLAWSVLLEVRRAGVDLATVTHAAGLSSTGDAALDAALPLEEAFHVPASTVAALSSTAQRGGRVVAVGTSVVRALEGSAAAHGRVVAGPQRTQLRLGPGSRFAVVAGLLTGMHEERSSHLALLSAFAGDELVRHAYDAAEARGYLLHELGDATLVLRGCLAGGSTGRAA